MPIARVRGAGDPAADKLLANIIDWLRQGECVPADFAVLAPDDARSRPVVDIVLSAEEAVVVADAGVRSLPPIGAKTGRRLVELRDAGDAVSFTVPQSAPPAEYQMLAWIRTGESAPTDRVSEYELRIGRRSWRLKPAQFELIFSHSGGGWAVWYGYGASPAKIYLRPGQRIVVAARHPWLYVGHVILRRTVGNR